MAGVLLTCLACAVATEQARAAYGDSYGLADAAGAIPGAKAFWAGTCDLANPLAEVGNAPGQPRDCIDEGTTNTVGSALAPWSPVPSWRLAAVAEAGAHPDATGGFTLTRDSANESGQAFVAFPAGSARDVEITLPAGFAGNPSALPKCSNEDFEASPATCPPSTQVGVSLVRTNNVAVITDGIYPVYNLEPLPGRTAEFGVPNVGLGITSLRIAAKVRSDDDFGVTTGVERIPTGFPLLQQSLTFWGVPWAASHDRFRFRIGYPLNKQAAPRAGLPAADRVSYDPSWGPIQPFISNPTRCDGTNPLTTIALDSWQRPGALLADGSPDFDDVNWKRADSPAAPVSDCADELFDGSLDVTSASSRADAPSAYGFDLEVPQNNEPPEGVAADPDDATGAPAHWRAEAGRATAHLRNTVVTLPEGVSVNPSGATGLASCSDAAFGVRGFDFVLPAPVRFTNDDPFDGQGQECPADSKIGTVTVRTPLLDEAVHGDVVLGEPKSTDPGSGQMLRLFLVLRSKERNLVVKVYGSAVADAQTGRLKATFANNPQLPFDSLSVQLKGGPRSVLANPPTCGTRSTTTLMEPWSQADLPEQDKTPSASDSPLTIDGDCDRGFDPGLVAGMSDAQAGGSGTFAFRFSRDDGEQYFKKLTAALPAGLLASVRGVTLCKDAEADAGACPAASRIGTVDATAGAGDPFVLEEKGEVFLTEGYKGGAYGLAVKVRAIAGPFRGAMELSPIVVRQAIHVDPTTAQVTAVSDDFPNVWHGVPLRIRSVTVRVDRDRLMVNPTNCAAKQIAGAFDAIEGASASKSAPFHATGCAALPFKPTLALQATGRNQVRTGTHPGIRAIVRQTGIGEAGIARAEVRLPKSLALDPDNAQALCEFEDGTKPDLENRCPAGSIVGRARAKTPLLDRDLVGNVYFVKNVRKDPTTGNLIRTLPMIVVALRGEIAVNLKGESSTTKGGKLVNTFANVPDAPITQFNLNITGGKTGILAVTRTRKARINLCATRQIAEADMDGQNGRRRDFDVRIKTPCTKKQTKAAKRQAKRVAAKAKRS